MDGSGAIAYARRHHLALLALFVALGGTAWAGAKIESNDIAKSAVRSKHIKAGQVRTVDLAGDAATGDKVAEGTLGKVPAAANADQASSAASADRLEGASLAEIAIGRSERNGVGCFPAGSGYTNCADVELDVPRAHRLLIVADAEVLTTSGGSDSDTIACRLEVDDQPLGSLHAAGLTTSGATGTFTPSTGIAHTEVSPVLPAGTHRAELACGPVLGSTGQLAGPEITVVALGAG